MLVKKGTTVIVVVSFCLGRRVAFSEAGSILMLNE